jgi:SNF family Na+-dependent transporter
MATAPGQPSSWGVDHCVSSARELAEAFMPTLVRFLVVLAILAGLGLAAMVALATLVQPDIRQITIPIPPDRLPTPRR